MPPGIFLMMKSAAAATAGALWTWGANTDLTGATGYGQLGDSSTASKSSPVQVGALTTWKQFAGGEYHSAAIKSDGTLWTWGFNASGQLGDGSTTSRSSPVQVGALTTWARVACGMSHTAAVKTDGTLWTFGGNSVGGLGDGSTTSRSSPVQVGALTTWARVACGGGFTISVKTDGTLWGMGANSGNLGLGNTTDVSSPTQCGALTTWSDVSAGGADDGARNTSYMLKTDGTVWAVGDANVGQLGKGNVTNRSSPTQVGLLTTWTSIKGCGAHVAATKTDGTLWMWGVNGHGELAQGNTTDRSSPVQVGILTNWTTKIATGGVNNVGSLGGHTTAIKSDGTLWAWGQNTDPVTGLVGLGQLGLGNTTDQSSPVQVGALTSWIATGAGAFHTGAIKP